MKLDGWRLLFPGPEPDDCLLPRQPAHLGSGTNRGYAEQALPARPAYLSISQNLIACRDLVEVISRAPG